jgi:hypothetical protein
MTTALGRLRTFLESVAKRRSLITYQELAKALEILPPHSIHRVTEALERLMEEDAAADRSSPRSPSARRVAACRRPGSSTAPDVSAGSRTVRTQGRFTPPS